MWHRCPDRVSVEIGTERQAYSRPSFSGTLERQHPQESRQAWAGPASFLGLYFTPAALLQTAIAGVSAVLYGPRTSRVQLLFRGACFFCGQQLQVWHTGVGEYYDSASGIN